MLRIYDDTKMVDNPRTLEILPVKHSTSKMVLATMAGDCIMPFYLPNKYPEPFMVKPVFHAIRVFDYDAAECEAVVIYR